MRKLNYLWIGFCGLAIALSGSVVMALPMAVTAPVAPAPAMPLATPLVTPVSVSQLNPSPSIFNEPPFNRAPRAQAPALPFSSSPAPALPDSATPDQKPVTAIAPVNSKVTLRFINQTGAAIDYEVLGQTQSRTLAGRSEIALQELTLPTTFTFRRQDKGFLLVTLQENNPAPGTLTLTVQETADFTVDRTSLYIDKAGNVFLS